MRTEAIVALLDAALEGRHLLDHPFYRRWEAGELAPGELAAYAEQYRHVERGLPGALETIAAGLPDGAARRLVRANLADERGRPEPHVALFERFAAAAGARAVDAGAPEADPVPAATPATTALVTLYRSASEDPAAGLAVLAAYEVQAAAVATSKADGLRRHYGMDRAGTEFWDVHATMEDDHATWTQDALATVEPDPVVVSAYARASADAWWAFLDEREVAACEREAAA